MQYLVALIIGIPIAIALGILMRRLDKKLHGELPVKTQNDKEQNNLKKIAL